MNAGGSARLRALSDDLAGYFADPSRYQDPFPMYRELREIEPVHWCERYDSWVITGYPEAVELLKHSGVLREPSAEAQFRHLGRRDIDAADTVAAVDIFLAAVINRDPPHHTRLRKLVSRSFSARAIESWRPRIDAIVDQLVGKVEAKSEFDLLRELAYPLPQQVICELLGVPLEDVDAITGHMGDSRIMTVRGAEHERSTPEDLRLLTQRQLVRQVEYFRAAIAERRRAPRADLITSLTQIEEEGDRLSMDELIGTVIILIGAGHETTANLVANGMLALLRNPDQWALLKAEPSLMPGAIEEILRHETPSRGQSRVARTPIEIGGKRIETGQQVMPLLIAANRDPRVFDDPERFDITRTPNPHITFTAGIHYCLGAVLAKAEAASMLSAICTRLDDLRLAVDEVRWRPSYVRGLESLPVARELVGAR
ncbi:cytochrome P450 [Amycolatopsis sp. GM8]|uniref:cytochrome P450 n=1 Tax=Amycolatopsis sp. GM8 TaxID=2896530 RepID=UPI001F2B640E|nr:cytochrome P450 [Amycolatopsis sp. GM8]